MYVKYKHDIFNTHTIVVNFMHVYKKIAEIWNVMYAKYVIYTPTYTLFMALKSTVDHWLFQRRCVRKTQMCLIWTRLNCQSMSVKHNPTSSGETSPKQGSSQLSVTDLSVCWDMYLSAVKQDPAGDGRGTLTNKKRLWECEIADEGKTQW